jgi:hypothetical protein
MDAVMQTARAYIVDFWTDVLRPDMPGIITFAVAILVVILLVCVGNQLVRQEAKEGMVGGRGPPGEYPSHGGLYPGTAEQLAESLRPLTITLFTDPHSAGRDISPSPPSSPSCNIVENVPFDARWITSRAGWAYGPMSGQAGLVGIGDTPN